MSDCNHLRVFNEFSKSSVFDTVVLTGCVPKLLPHLNNSLLRRLLKVVELIICHIGIGRKIKENKKKEIVIVHGFSTEFLFFLYIFSHFKTTGVYFLTHHNIQQAFQNRLIKFLFKMYCRIGYKFILNETCLALKEFGFNDKEVCKHISMLHPVVGIDSHSSFVSEVSRRKRIGLVGKVSKGKQFSETLNLLLRFQKSLDFSLIIGTDNFSHFDGVDLGEAKLINTSHRGDYLSVLASCDVIVLGYERSKYFYRCSGVAADAISAKTFVVCPDFPLMSNQVNYPTQVGVLYKNDSDLEVAIRHALELASNPNNALFKAHYLERSIEKTASTLLKDVQARSCK